MNKITINVPAGIRFLTDWKEFCLPENPCIINKQITGCGFTEWCIRNNQNVILCSPRRILLENKEEQHPGEVLYLSNTIDIIEESITSSVDEDLNKLGKSNIKQRELTDEQKEVAKKTILEMKNKVLDYYYNNYYTSKLPCKILVTYDSFRHIKEALGYRINDFHIVIDEFQSIFTDSKFKSSTELEFLNYLRDLNKVAFVSATPYVEKYLDQLIDFKDLPYYELDWGTLEPSRVVLPEIQSIPCDSILPIAKDIIQSYLDGNFQKYIYRDNYGNIQEIESRELVIYVNSVKNICDIITKCGLTLENTNVLCANYLENQKKIRKAFNITKRGVSGIGKVPKEGDPHKMFTLCTRTVYLGADFYSTCARTVILSDANVDCLAVDIRLDLPQIMGRQRLFENPWKNRAELYFKSILKNKDKDMTPEEEFNLLLELVMDKKKKTEKLLSAYNKLDLDEQKELAEVYLDRAISKKYKSDYVAVNTHDKLGLVPVFNELYMISEIRGYELQRVIYANKFTVASNVRDDRGLNLSNSDVYEFLSEFNRLKQFIEKMKYLCDKALYFSIEDLSVILGQIPLEFGNYYNILGPVKIKSLNYQKSKLEDEYNKLVYNQENKDSVINYLITKYIPGNKYLLSDIKLDLTNLFNRLGIKDSPKASYLENFFEVKKVLVSNKTTGKRDSAYEIIKIK